MNATHAVAGVSSGGAVGILTGLLASTFHLDPTVASEWAMLLVGVGGAVYSLLYSWLNQKAKMDPALGLLITDLPAPVVDTRIVPPHMNQTPIPAAAPQSVPVPEGPAS